MTSTAKKVLPNEGYIYWIKLLIIVYWLINYLISKDMGDLKVKIENCEVMTIKLKICGSNELIRTLELFITWCNDWK